LANVFHDVFQLILNNLYLIGVLALSTMGITLTYKTTNVANFSQAITSTIGAYMAGLMVRDFGCNPWLAMVAGVLLCFVIGVLVDAVVVRNIGGGSGRTMVTIALIVIFTAGIPLVYGTIPYNFPRFFKEQIEFTLFGMQFNVTQNALFVLLLSIAVIGLIFAALNLTKWGLGVRGTSSNLYVAAMMGVNTNMMTALSWGISSACGALAAILLASQTQVINLTMLGSVQANSLLAFVLGGFSSFYGPVVGAAIIPVVQSLMAFISGIWASALLYIVVMLVILIKPAGLFGKSVQKKV
jgi:branched-chain amino acid transport system permease protein